jgi:hypothetical protein
LSAQDPCLLRRNHRTRAEQPITPADEKSAKVTIGPTCIYVRSTSQRQHRPEFGIGIRTGEALKPAKYPNRHDESTRSDLGPTMPGTRRIPTPIVPPIATANPKATPRIRSRVCFRADDALLKLARSPCHPIIRVLSQLKRFSGQPSCPGLVSDPEFIFASESSTAMYDSLP